MHLNSELLFQKYAKELFKDNMRVLEIGPDCHPSTYKKLVGNKTLIWDTLDVYSSPNLTYVAENEYKFPISSNTYDIVISGQVIEHVRKVWVWIEELSRVCRIGGHVITISPISWPYHEAPIDCWRIYPEGMKALYEAAGLLVTLSKYESLEVNCPGRPKYPKLIPGESYQEKKGYRASIKKLLGWPMTYSLDTITMGLKEK